MKKVLAWFLGFCLVGLPSLIQAAGIDVDILADNHYPFPQYRTSSERPQTYRSYVEAVRGERYGIRVRNNLPVRVGVVIAVDGRNIISGKKSYLKRDERMYVLEPYTSAVYDGWRTSRNQVNRFYFTDAPDSYAGAWGDYSAMGVIAIAAFQERRPPEPPPILERREEKEGLRKDAPAPGTKMRAGEQAGTGYGEDKYSPSYRVEFEPEPVAVERHFFKYEWRETLCRKGIIDCREPRNRFWLDDRRDYAPPPPRR